LKSKINYIIASLILASCSGKKDIETNPPPLNHQYQTVEANPENGYIVNSVTGDTINPIVLESGDTVRTGVPIDTKGKIIDMDSCTQAKTIPVKHPDSSFNANPNVKYVPDNLKVRFVNHDSLNKFSVQKINDLPSDNSQSVLSHYILNSTGDTVLTGLPQPVKGKVVKVKQPRATSALPPEFKDAAIANIQYLDVDHGMSSSYVISSAQDRDGNLWFGTNGGGVGKYDGNVFMHFTIDNGLINSIVRTILEDTRGNLWFGTDGGISMYDGRSFTNFTEKQGLSSNKIKSIIEDKNGNIWFASLGGGVSKFDGECLIHFTKKEGLSSNDIRTLKEDRDGNLWLGTARQGIIKYDGKSFTHFTEKDGLSNNKVWSILEDSRGDLWFGTYGGGVNKYDGKSFTHITEKEGLSSNTIWSIHEDSSGNLWFGTRNGGVNKYDGKSLTHYTEREGLSNNSVWSILEDNSGNLWFSTNGGGVSKYDSRSFKHYTVEEGLSNSLVMSAGEDKMGNLWFGTIGGGVSKYNGKSFSHYTKNEGLPNNVIMSIIEDKDENIWLATYGGGVCKYDGESLTHFTEKQGLSDNAVLCILEDKEGNIWFGTKSHGVSKYDGKSFTHYTVEEGLSSNFVWSILEDKTGNIWFSTMGGGVTKYDGKSFVHYTEKEGLSNNFVYSIIEDKKGKLWFGTNEGITRYDGKSFVYFTEKNGLSDNVVFSLIDDNENNIWAGTENGLTLFDFDEYGRASTQNEEELKKDLTDDHFSLYRFKKPDGLKGLDFQVNSAFLDSESRMWWGSGKSLTSLAMKKFEVAQTSPAVFLRQLDIDEQFIDYRNLPDSLANSIKMKDAQVFNNYPLNLELPYYKNHLTFHFSAIDWFAPYKIQYSYIMEGLNTTWSNPTKEPKADYRNLSYGTYTFKVRAIGESGDWSEPFEYTFTITPPWWHTWWARGLYVLFAITFIFILFRWRTAKLKKRQIELEFEVDSATHEIRMQKEVVEKQKKEVENQKGIIEETHKEITDSISYARRIQNAILPPYKLIKQYLPESFILYKPKDVVAGDFYWMEKMEGRILIAAADCTGHGVPGAMVSVVCNNGLNRSVREYGLTDPGGILNMTRDIIVQEFEKSENDVNDGMDIALCKLDFKSPSQTVLHYAGAHNPLWIIRNNEILETKANKQPIGKFHKPQPFTTHTFELQKGDTIYLFSDGYVDQFGGEKGKKFKATKFRKLLLSVQNKPMEEQRVIIDETFEAWKGNLEQVDDVCVIGVRIE